MDDPNLVNPYSAPPALEEAPAGPSPVQVPMNAEIRALFERGQNGAAWFYWVAALSLVNSVMSLAGVNIGFALGLGITLIADGLVMGEELPIRLIALGFDLLVLGAVVGCGWLSKKRILPIYAMGMFLYLLDGLLFLMFGDIVSIAIHGFALWGMWNGFMAYRELNALERRLAQQALPAGF